MNFPRDAGICFSCDAGASRQFFAGGGETPASRCDRRPFRRARESARALRPRAAPSTTSAGRFSGCTTRSRSVISRMPRAPSSSGSASVPGRAHGIEADRNWPHARLARGEQLPGEVQQQVELEIEPHEIGRVRRFVVGLLGAGRALRAHRRPAARAGCARRDAARRRRSSARPADTSAPAAGPRRPASRTSRWCRGLRT